MTSIHAQAKRPLGSDGAVASNAANIQQGKVGEDGPCSSGSSSKGPGSAASAGVPGEQRAREGGGSPAPKRVKQSCSTGSAGTSVGGLSTGGPRLGPAAAKLKKSLKRL